MHPCAYISLDETGCIGVRHDAQVQSGPERLANVNFCLAARVCAPQRGRPSARGHRARVARRRWAFGMRSGKGSAAPGALSPGPPGSHVPGAFRPRRQRRLALPPDYGPGGAPARERGRGLRAQPAAQMAGQPRAGTLSQAFKKSTFFPA